MYVSGIINPVCSFEADGDGDGDDFECCDAENTDPLSGLYQNIGVALSQ